MTGIDTPPASSDLFEGLGGEHIFSEKKSEAERIELAYEFKFLGHQQGKDLYRISREVKEISQTEADGKSVRGRSTSFEVAYDGSPLTIRDDKYGVTKLMSRQMGIKDGKYVDGSIQSGACD